MDSIECVVIGAGVVGLAVARALAAAGREVVVVEQAAAIGADVSSRNSEVIHAGLYCASGSLKAQLCVHGKALLYDYCAERHLPHRRCGKLVVATRDDDVSRLEALRQAGIANGVHDLEFLGRDETQRRAPALHCAAALWSPSSGIVDVHVDARAAGRCAARRGHARIGQSRRVGAASRRRLGVARGG